MLQEVVGGRIIPAIVDGKNVNLKVGPHVESHSGVLGKKYIFTRDGGEAWIYGILKNSREEHNFLWTTKRVHDVEVLSTDKAMYPYRNVEKLYAEDWSIHEVTIE